MKFELPRAPKAPGDKPVGHRRAEGGQVPEHTPVHSIEQKSNSPYLLIFPEFRSFLNSENLLEFIIYSRIIRSPVHRAVSYVQLTFRWRPVVVRPFGHEHEVAASSGHGGRTAAVTARRHPWDNE